AFFRGEVQAQKKSIGDLRVSVDKVTTEVTKLAEQVKAQHELKVDVTDHVTPEDLDQVWNQLNALQNAVFPEVSPSPLSAVDPQESLSFEPPRENSLQSTSWIENPAFQPPGSLSSSPAFHSAFSGSTPASSSGYQSSITFDPIPLFTELRHSQQAAPISILYHLQRLHGGRGTSQGSLKTVQNELIELSPLCARPALQSYLQGNTMIATGKDSYSQRILGGVDKLESSPSSALRTERFHQPYPPGPHQFLQAWALVTHRHLSQPLPDEYRIWSSNLKMGVSNSIDVVPPEEGVREFAERVLQVYDLFNMADPLMFAQELERYPTLYVFKAGLPEDYSPHITKILQELGVRTMDRDQQLMHIITKLQNYHEFVISVKHDNSGVTSTTSTPGRNAHSSSAGHHTPSPPQAQETGYTRPLRRAFPAAHVTLLDEDVHDVPVHDSEYAYDTGPSHSQIPIDDDQERVPSLQEELVEVHAHATFPSTMHPRGNPRPAPSPSAGNSYQQRPPGSTGAPGPASTSRPIGAPSVGTTYQPNKMVG
ncbi:hypothetical protein CEUSTIGMA_g11515.t1, partial [Chlamydomonas eustigma]